MTMEISGLNNCQAPIVCDWCGGDSCTLWFCQTCDSRLCSRCKTSHAKKIKFQSHLLLPLTEAIRMRYSGPCSDHIHLSLSLFCKTCEKEVCTECFIKNHNGHNYDRITNAAESIKKELQGYRDTLKDKLAKIKLEQRKVEKQINACEKWISDVEKDVNLIRKQIKDVTDNRCDKILQEAKKETEQTISSLSDKKENLQMIGEDLDELARRTENSLHAYFRDIAEYNKTKPKLEEFNVPLVTSLHLPQFKPGRIDPDQMFAMIGELAEMRVEISVLSKSTHDSYICSIKPGNAENVWLTEKDKHHIKLVTMDGQVVCESIKAPNTVNDFVVLKSNDFVTTHYNKCSIVKISQDNSCMPLIDTSPYRPSGICLSKDNHRFIVSLSHPDGHTQLAMYDMNGENLKDYKYTDKVGMGEPVQRVTLNENGDILVLHWNLDTVFILDDKGTLKFTYSDDGVSRFDLFDVCCDADGHILISDRGNSKILMLDRQGNLVGVIMTEKVDIKTPSAILVNTDGSLWVGYSSGDLAVVKYNK